MSELDVEVIQTFGFESILRHAKQFALEITGDEFDAQENLLTNT